MKIFITLIFLTTHFLVFCQNTEILGFGSLGFENTIEFELSKVEIKLHSFDSISIESTYLDSLNFTPKILAFNISGVDADGNELFTRIPKGNKIPLSFKTKYQECGKCKFIRVKKVTLTWFYGESYVPNKSKQWKIDR
jgi:hypothetical protein